jgi:hypothetical protein
MIIIYGQLHKMSAAFFRVMLGINQSPFIAVKLLENVLILGLVIGPFV